MTVRKAAARSEALPQTWLLHGEDSRFFEGPAERWSKAWGEEEGVLRLAAPGLAAPALYTELHSLPLMRSRQVLRLTHLEAAAPDILRVISEYLAKPSLSTCLLLEFLGGHPGTGKESKAGQREDPRKELLRTIFERAPSLHCKAPSVRALASERASREGVRFAPGALEALEEWVGGDHARTSQALDLLFLYKGPEKVVEEKDLAALLGAGTSPQRWDLQDAFVNRNGPAFYRLLEAVRRDPEVERDATGTAIAFGAMIAKQARSLLTAKGLAASGKAPREITPEDLGLKQYPAQKVLGALAKWDEAAIREALEALYFLDLALKGGGEGGEAWDLVQKRLAPFLKFPGGRKLEAQQETRENRQ